MIFCDGWFKKINARGWVGFSIDVQKFLEKVDSTNNPEFVNRLKEAFNWLATRLDYSFHYYQQLKKSATSKNLEASILMFDRMARIRFEAPSLAYSKNIHATCDAFPFSLHILLGGLLKAQSSAKNEYFQMEQETHREC